jgi:hypothetical protein
LQKISFSGGAVETIADAGIRRGGQTRIYLKTFHPRDKDRDCAEKSKPEQHSVLMHEVYRLAFARLIE